MIERGEKRGYISALLNEYASGGYDSYHTPGHKGEFCPRDVTELGIGGKIFPADAVIRAQERTAKLYGVRAVRYLTNGSSIGIKASLLLFRGKKVLFASGAHKAFADGCELADIKPVPIARHGEKCVGGAVFTCGCGNLPAPLEFSEAEEALKRNPDASALFITSPDYLGRTADIEIAKLCKSRGVALIADSAHGAHFAFAPELGKFRFDNVADLCNMSAHKTLGAYTQTALLAVNEPRFLPEAEHALGLLGTTSENYALLERLENSVLEASANFERFAYLNEVSQKIRAVADVLPNSDYTRICVKPRAGTAEELFDALYKKGIACEAVINGRVVFILTPYDSEEKLTRLIKELTEKA